MLCPKCGYMMDAFDKECPRCHGAGVEQSTPALSPTASTPAANPVPASPVSQASNSDQNLKNGKKLGACCGLGCFVPLLLALILGGFFESKPYKVVKRNEGLAQITYEVRVSPDASKSDIEDWAEELEARGGGKSTMVNFYDGPSSMAHFIYSCTSSSGECDSMRD